MFKCTSCGDELFPESRKYEYQGKLVCSDCFVKQRSIDHSEDNDHKLDPNGCKLQVMEWVMEKYPRTIIHAMDGTWTALEGITGTAVYADTIPLLSDVLLNCPEHGISLQNSPQFTERLNEQQENRV